MSETGTLLLARAKGRDLLLEASQLLEMLPPTALAPLPGPVPGIAGVILYQGEFLPVLDWEALPGEAAPAAPTALGVLRRRLALPLEALSGVVEAEAGERRIEPAGEDPWGAILACRCSLGGPALPLLDPDRLVDWLHQRRTGR